MEPNNDNQGLDVELLKERRSSFIENPSFSLKIFRFSLSLGILSFFVFNIYALSQYSNMISNQHEILKKIDHSQSFHEPTNSTTTLNDFQVIMNDYNTTLSEMKELMAEENKTNISAQQLIDYMKLLFTTLKTLCQFSPDYKQYCNLIPSPK
tara:strand:+ start:20049 stop:20504 length:456 start_codon:yes stop_codon:yes gene_type:complete